MTRMEFNIADAVKECKKSGVVNMVAKLKTFDNYNYTIAEFKYFPENHSEKGFFDFLALTANQYLAEIGEAIKQEGMVWMQDEGRMINTKYIKEIWLEFDANHRTEIFLDDTQSMYIEAFREEGLEEHQKTGKVSVKSSL